MKFLLSNREDDSAKDIDYIRGDVTFLLNIFEKIYQLNLKLQGPNFNLIEAKAAVLTFAKKLEVIKTNTGRRERNQFSNMQSTALAQHFSDIDFQVYCSHIDSLRKDFESRFKYRVFHNFFMF